ncbi:MAG: hypothetical protein U5L45_23780 [Saprospiraceae bacterium]|nr:hypothetical protein [Saprospiraceae bacterium]
MWFVFSAKPKNEPHSLPRASEASARCKNAFRSCPSLNYLVTRSLRSRE